MLIFSNVFTKDSIANRLNIKPKNRNNCFKFRLRTWELVRRVDFLTGFRPDPGIVKYYISIEVRFFIRFQSISLKMQVTEHLDIKTEPGFKILLKSEAIELHFTMYCPKGSIEDGCGSCELIDGVDEDEDWEERHSEQQQILRRAGYSLAGPFIRLGIKSPPSVHRWRRGPQFSIFKRKMQSNKSHYSGKPQKKARTKSG